MSTGRVFIPTLTVRSARWQIQPTSGRKEFSSLINFCTPDFFSFITFVVSDMNVTALLNPSPFFARDSFSTLNKLAAVPMFTTGIPTNLVHTSPILGSRNVERMMQDLSDLSFDSSIFNENGLFLIDSNTLSL